jgi:hypothetical protein
MAKGFQKGHQKVGGKQKGTPNKITNDVRQRYKDFVEGNLDNLDTWLDRVATTDPDKALDFMLKFSEYFIPKLQRTELTGQDGQNLIPDEIKVTVIHQTKGLQVATNEKEVGV